MIISDYPVWSCHVTESFTTHLRSCFFRVPKLAMTWQPDAVCDGLLASQRAEWLMGQGRSCEEAQRQAAWRGMTWSLEETNCTVASSGQQWPAVASSQFDSLSLRWCVVLQMSLFGQIDNQSNVSHAFWHRSCKSFQQCSTCPSAGLGRCLAQSARGHFAVSKQHRDTLGWSWCVMVSAGVHMSSDLQGSQASQE